MSLRVSIVQENLHWENPDQNFIHFESILKTISDSDLVILPEMFTTGFSMNIHNCEAGSEHPAQWLSRMAKSFGMGVGGSYMQKLNKDYFNTFSIALPDGSIHSYHKRHLFGMAGENEIFAPGDKQLIFDYKGWKIALMVCYDLRFPVWSRRTEKFNYDLLVYTANWPERRSYAWKNLLVARAIENQSFVVGVNRIGKDGKDILYSGDSIVLNPMGKSIFEAPPFHPFTQTINLEKSTLENIRKQLPFFNDGDYFEIKKGETD
jgi:omega-amidase